MEHFRTEYELNYNFDFLKFVTEFQNSEQRIEIVIGFSSNSIGNITFNTNVKLYPKRQFKLRRSNLMVPSKYLFVLRRDDIYITPFYDPKFSDILGFSNCICNNLRAALAKYISEEKYGIERGIYEYNINDELGKETFAQRWNESTEDFLECIDFIETYAEEYRKIIFSSMFKMRGL